MTGWETQNHCRGMDFPTVAFKKFGLFLLRIQFQNWCWVLMFVNVVKDVSAGLFGDCSYTSENDSGSCHLLKSDVCFFSCASGSCCKKHFQMVVGNAIHASHFKRGARIYRLYSIIIVQASHITWMLGKCILLLFWYLFVAKERLLGCSWHPSPMVELCSSSARFLLCKWQPEALQLMFVCCS